MSVESRLKELEEKIKSIEIRLTNQRSSFQVQEFDDLIDTPANKTGSGKHFVTVNSGEADLEYKAGCYDYHCRIYLDNDQNNITQASNVKILMDTVDIDDGSMADIANNKITTIVAGRYRIGLHLTWNVTFLNVQYYNMIWVDGASTCNVQSPSSFAGYVRISQSTIFDIAAGIDIEAYCRHEGAAATPDIISGHHNTFLMVTLLREL